MHATQVYHEAPPMTAPARVVDRQAPVGKAAAILAAAERAFLAGGFGAVTMDAIAREAAVSKATVYAHYTGKEELFGAVVARLSERRFGGFSVEALDPGDIAASLTTIAVRFLDLVLSAEAIALNRIIIGEVTRFPVLGEVFWAAGPERSRVQIEAFLRRAAEAGTLVLPDARRAAEQFVALARGEIHLRSLLRLEDPGDPAAIEAAVASTVATFLRAFQPPGAANRTAPRRSP
jgi:TetR/AcrR family transcriptional regulator, mexJK operon transcriptional repressor